MRTPAPPSPRRRGLVGLTAASLVAAPLAFGLAAPANADVSDKVATFPYSQGWSNAALITANDNWSGVAGVQGYLGQDLTAATGTDAQTVLSDSSAALDTDVLANQTNTSLATGGVAEFDSLTNATVAIQGSGTADAPYIAFHLDLSGKTAVSFDYTARDLDGSADDAAQQVALQYRVGATGTYTNLPTGYIADATTAGAATLTTSRTVALPAAVENQASVFVRAITTNAAGNDEWVGIDDVSITATSGPSPLAAPNPGAQSSTVGTAITPVTLTPGGGTGPYTVVATNLPAGLTFDPDSDQISGTPTTAGTTTVQVGVTDSAGGNDTDSFVWTVSEPAAPISIAQIQGTSASSPLVGDTVTTRGVVTAAYPAGGFFGFYIQTPGTGAANIDLMTHTASDGVFVRQPSGDIAVTPGDYVEVTGEVTEFAGATQVQAQPTAITELSEVPEPIVTTTTATWPRAAAQKESLEGMRYRPTGAFTVSNTFSTNNFGEVGLANGTQPLIQRTEVELPGPAGSSAVEADNTARAVVLDDGASTNFLSSGNGGLTPPYISTTEPVRVGANTTFTADVIFTEGGSPSAPTYRFQPLAAVTGPDNAASPATFENTRTAAPDEALINEVGQSDLKIASFNVLNYFTTLGDANDDNVGDGGCTPFRDRDGDGNSVSSGCDQRGAWDPQDFARQQSKIVSAINALDADVVGLMEIENSRTLGETPDEATNSLVAALNAAAGAGTWAANPSSTELPADGMDVITNAIIYKPAAVARVGQARALGSLSDSGEAFDNAREPLGQVFQPVGGTPFLFVVNHFKSKGSAGPNPGDADSGDGQSSSNGSRKLQAAALRDWVSGLQAETGVKSVILGGEFNSYAMEDPLRILYDAGFTNVEQKFGNGEYSYSFSGLSGSLDHILVNDGALKRSTGTDIWNINGGESLALEYSRYNYHGTDFHAAGPFRSSDHDPVILGLKANDPVVPPAPGAVDTTVTATADKIVYGEAGSVSVKVTPASATGSVTLTNGTAVVGTAALAAGAATIALPARSLPVGKATLTLSYTGDAAHKASTGSVVVKVKKAGPKVKVKPKISKAGATKAKIIVKVRAQGFTPTGKVTVRVAGKTYKVRLKDGRGVVRVNFKKPRTYVAHVKYIGDATTESAKTKKKIRVTRR